MPCFVRTKYSCLPVRFITWNLHPTKSNHPATLNLSNKNKMAASKKSFSLPDTMLKAAIDRQKQFGYATFSDYLQAVIQADLRERPDEHVRVTKAPRPRKK
jgi:hypothetical protein